jgi:uncharacterized protein (DUF1778 family)
MTDTPTIQAWRARQVLGLEDFTEADLEAIRTAEPPPEALEEDLVIIPEHLTDPDKQVLIEQAAEVLGQSPTEFMRDAACREALAILRRQYDLTLDGEAFAALQALLEAPPRENPRLRALLATPAPWES